MHPLFEVRSDEIQQLNNYQFRDVVNRLLRVEAARHDVAMAQVDTSLRDNDPDAGIDARVIAPEPLHSHWLPSGLSVWQYKAGKIRLEEVEREFNKPGVQEAIQRGGTYCLVVGWPYMVRGVDNRKQKLKDLFEREGVTPKFRLYVGSHVASWASDCPAIVLLPHIPRPVSDDLMPFENWLGLEDLRVSQLEFQPDDHRRAIMDEVRRATTQRTGFVHLRIEGRPGVGKTRLALEALRVPGLREQVLYALSPEGVPLTLFSHAEAHPQAQFVLVVDECDEDWADRLRRRAERCEERVVLLTIGHGEAPMRRRMVPDPVFSLDTLGDQEMEKVIRSVSPMLYPEAVAWVVRMASGYVKLATALASALVRSPELAGASDLVQSHDVQRVLQTLLPDKHDRRSMQALALLSRVGWEGEVADEGKAIAEFLGLPWRELQEVAERMRKQGLIIKRGRYRYVTPHMLAVWLAAAAWDAYGQELVQLLEQLPRPASKRAFIERLADLGDHERAQEVARKLLSEEGLFRDLESLDDPLRAEIHGSLAMVDPRAGLYTLERILLHLPRDQLVQFRRGRRHVVWTLERLAWLPETFEGAARVLLALAEAENEAIANNATGIWAGLFRTHLGGTAVPAVERYHLVEEALAGPSVERRMLAVRALEAALSTREIRFSGGEDQRGRLAPPEWHPSTLEEDRAIRRSALRLLDKALGDPEPQVANEARNVLFKSAHGLVTMGLADEVLDRIEGLRLTDDKQRRNARDTLEAMLRFESAYLTEAQKERIAAHCEGLIGNTFADRLRRWVGAWSNSDWLYVDDESRPRPEEQAAALADLAHENPELLRQELDWLASPEARNVWYFARRLGKLDEAHQWLDELLDRARQHQGLTLLAGYLQGRADGGEAEWREETLDRWAETEPSLIPAVLEATWRGQTSERGARRLILLVNSGRLEPAKLGLLAWGGWPAELPEDVFRDFLSCLMLDENREATESALHMLRQRLKAHPEDYDSLSPLAWELLERHSALSGTGTIAYAWGEIAKLYVSQDPIRMARAVLSAIAESEHVSLARNERVLALAKATSEDPRGVWQEVAEVLLRRDQASFRLRLALRRWYGGLIPTEHLLEWAEQHQPDGPRIIAELTPVGDAPLGHLSRELLIHYGDDRAVRNTLVGNFRSGSFSGPISAWLEGKLATAREWMKDSHPAVKSWAQQLVDALEEEIRATKFEEEERGW